MSLLSPSSLRVGISSRTIILALTSFTKIKSWQEISLADPSLNKQQLITNWIAPEKFGIRSTHIYLSHSICPTYIVPWDISFHNETSSRHIAIEFLEQIYPNVDQRFDIHFVVSGFGGPLIVSILDKIMLAKLLDEFAFIKPSSIQAALPAHIGRLLRKFKQGTFVIKEPDFFHIINLSKGVIKFIRSLPISNLETCSIEQIVERELMLEGITNAKECHVLNQQKSLLHSGWKNNSRIPIETLTMIGTAP